MTAIQSQTVPRPPGFNPDEFFLHNGERTLVGPVDLDEAIPDPEKPFLDEVERYWLNKPYSFAVIYHSRRENQPQYYAIEPHLSAAEQILLSFLDDQLRMEIDYEGLSTTTSQSRRISLIENTVITLLRRYNLIDRTTQDSEEVALTDRLIYRIATTLESRAEKRRKHTDETETVHSAPAIASSSDDLTMLSPTQVEKLIYYLTRNFVGYERIDPLKHDIHIEDISCDGPDTELFIYHSSHEQILTNISFNESDLNTYVKRLANSSGKGISRRQPDVDTTLPDGSRVQLTLAEEITTKGSNFTIRQFLDIPFTPIDLINWQTFSIDQIAFLWLCIQYNRSVIFAGGTASGKTTTQNAMSLFIPSSSKIVSIEDTPELELPQKNWIASITRQSFSKHGMDAVDEYHLLENSLRQRPDYIIMGEVRGEEGRTLFQAMASGHTVFTTFHANNALQVIQRFTTDPINVMKPYFDTLDLIVLQQETRVSGRKARRCRAITEIERYDTDTDHLEINDVSTWDPATDTIASTGTATVLKAIRQENGWDSEQLTEELLKRKVVLSYLIKNEINEYASVAGTIQGFMIDEQAILHLIQTDTLDEYVSNLRTIRTLNIDVNPAREQLIPRPSVPDSVKDETRTILTDADQLLRRYRAVTIDDSFSILTSHRPAEDETEPALDVDPVFVDANHDELTNTDPGE